LNLFAEVCSVLEQNIIFSTFIFVEATGGIRGKLVHSQYKRHEGNRKNII